MSAMSPQRAQEWQAENQARKLQQSQQPQQKKGGGGIFGGIGRALGGVFGGGGGRGFQQGSSPQKPGFGMSGGYGMPRMEQQQGPQLPQRGPWEQARQASEQGNPLGLGQGVPPQAGSWDQQMNPQQRSLPWGQMGGADNRIGMRTPWGQQRPQMNPQQSTQPASEMQRGPTPDWNAGPSPIMQQYQQGGIDPFKGDWSRGMPPLIQTMGRQMGPGQPGQDMGMGPANQDLGMGMNRGMGPSMQGMERMYGMMGGAPNQNGMSFFGGGMRQPRQGEPQ